MPARACITPSLAATEAAGRTARHSRHHQPRRQIVIPRDPPAVARLRRIGRAARGAEIPRRGRRDFRHRLFFHGNLVRHRHAQGQDRHPFDARPGASQQGCRGQGRAGRRCRPRARRAARGDRQEREHRSRRIGRRRRDRRLAQGMAGEMDAEADQQRRPAQPLSRALGSAAHRRHREHHHHP